jgi:hypothetical protein
MIKIVSVLYCMLSQTACFPFRNSLKNPTLVRPPPVEAMMSFNTLTPHYEEDVIFALSAADTSRQLGLAGPDAHKVRFAIIWSARLM